MDFPGKEALLSLLGEEVYDGLISLTALIDSLYDVDRTWDKGFGSWKYEYKYRRGGLLSMKPDACLRYSRTRSFPNSLFHGVGFDGRIKGLLKTFRLP